MGEEDCRERPCGSAQRDALVHCECATHRAAGFALEPDCIESDRQQGRAVVGSI